MLLAADWQMIGSFADWITAVVAAVAGFIAYKAFEKTSATNEAQQETLELQRKQYEESQAGQVTFWTDGLNVLIMNASNSPIYQVAYFQESARYVEQCFAYQPVVLPSGPEPSVIPMQHEIYGKAKARNEIDTRDRIWFRDAMGRQWVRLMNGELQSSFTVGSYRRYVEAIRKFEAASPQQRRGV